MAEIEWLTFDMFAPRVGETFDVSVGESRTSVPMVLVDATESSEPGGTGPDGQQRLQFSLVFRDAQRAVLPQGTYRLTHAELGVLDVFLVPIGPDAEGMQYEAVFA